VNALKKISNEHLEFINAKKEGNLLLFGIKIKEFFSAMNEIAGYINIILITSFPGSSANSKVKDQSSIFCTSLKPQTSNTSCLAFCLQNKNLHTQHQQSSP
jgi:hypothetical protein